MLTPVGNCLHVWLLDLAEINALPKHMQLWLQIRNIKTFINFSDHSSPILETWAESDMITYYNPALLHQDLSPYSDHLLETIEAKCMDLSKGVGIVTSTDSWEFDLYFMYRIMDKFNKVNHNYDLFPKDSQQHVITYIEEALGISFPRASLQLVETVIEIPRNINTNTRYR